MEPLDLTGVERALVVTAHPDDVDFGFAGSVARLTDAGIEVTYCIVTDGDAGGAETGIPREEMAPKRREEQTAAAAVVGVHDLHFLGYPDGRVESTLDLRRDISRVIRTGAARPGAHAVARPQLGSHLREPSRSPRGRRRDDRRGLSRRPQPLGAPRARGRRARAVDGGRRCGWARAAPT